MKKELRVKDLPETLRDMLMNHPPFKTVNFNADNAMDILSKIDWTKATDKERLAYAEWRYTYGTKVESNVDSIAVSNGIFRIVGDVIYAGRINDIDSLNIYDAGKWCKIISTPDQSKEPLFKVGDRPQWTPELIKQLPHGTVLECAYVSSDTYRYCGENVFDNNVGIWADTSPTRLAFYSLVTGEYARILSLPDIKEASPEAQQEFVKANPGMQHVEEPKAGDMVEGSNGNGWEIAKFTGGTLSSGDFICEDTKYDGKRSLRNSIMFYEKIRLPQKSEVESKVRELVRPLCLSDHIEPDVIEFGLSCIKWGQANPDKI